MDEKQMLLMAAKAAGIGGGWDWPRGAKSPTCYRDSAGRAWLPKDDDGDSRRLEVALRMTVSCCQDVVLVSHWEGGAVISERLGDDPAAAVRLAVLKLAAAIGEQSNG